MKTKGTAVFRLGTSFSVLIQVIAGVLVGVGQSQASEALLNPQNLSKKQIERFSDVLICARTLVQKFGKSDPEAIRLAGTYLEQLAPAVDNLDTLKEIHASCRASIQELRARALSGAAEVPDADRESLADFSPHVRETLRQYRSPSEVCTVSGPEVSAALGVGVTSGLLGGVCEKSDGRQVLVLGLEAGVLAGLAATVGASIYEFEMDPDDLAVGWSSEGVGIAVGIGIRLGSSAFGGSGTLEVGAGIYWYKTAAGVLKVLPLGSNRKYMVYLFFMNRENESSGVPTPVP